MERQSCTPFHEPNGAAMQGCSTQMVKLLMIRAGCLISRADGPRFGALFMASVC